MYIIIMYVCMSSVTLVRPAKAVGWNEMPFGRDTVVVPANIVLDRVADALTRCCDRQISLVLIFLSRAASCRFVPCMRSINHETAV